MPRETMNCQQLLCLMDEETGFKPGHKVPVTLIVMKLYQGIRWLANTPVKLCILSKEKEGEACEKEESGAAL